MTQDRDPVQQYLDQLRLSLARETRHIVTEAEGHLLLMAASGQAPVAVHIRPAKLVTTPQGTA